ncbi:leucyl aminopeptidase family protein [Roseinatronobacter sp. NSM]|uniref:leucyl aminopeptidase family protein n=1 Tax=Roseinatronobacter sp. NSM TaxID=3457785 RepID=UPI0040353898
MTEFTAPPTLRFATSSGSTVPLHLVTKDELAGWTEMQPRRMRAWLDATGFTAAFGTIALVPDPDGGLAAAAVGLGTAMDRQRARFCLGGARPKLPAATFHLEHGPEQATLDEELLGWLLAGYRFDKFRTPPTRALAQLVAPKSVDATKLEAIAAGEALTRDLINTPASHMGPEDLEAAFVGLGQAFGAEISVIYGDELLYHNFPLVHAVGRASDRSPRLLDMRWGTQGPQLTLVGKGVCFDTGGLNLKPGASMGLMKKDMGGAATVMGLAHMIMSQGWPVRLRVIVPAVENAVSGNAMRPGDVLLSRKGVSIEVNNTDAEGRLVLADALTLADEETPDMIICMATLTGAARVAVGPDIAPFFTRDTALSAALLQSGDAVRDPVWPLPLHPGYEANIQPGIADLDNAPSGGMAGAITAALFLHRFVENTPRFVHFDIYGHQPVAAPARPKGGVGQAARALFDALPAALKL